MIPDALAGNIHNLPPGTVIYIPQTEMQLLNKNIVDQNQAIKETNRQIDLMRDELKHEANEAEFRAIYAAQKEELEKQAKQFNSINKLYSPECIIEKRNCE